MRVLIVDNYDSFTYNLQHYVRNEGVDVDVVRNDQVQLADLSKYDALILSPGPGLPSETANMTDLLQAAYDRMPVLGVCLGMQGMAEFFGGRLVNQKQVKHGFQEGVAILTQTGIFEGLPAFIQVGLYHSWMVDETSLSADWEITARSENGVVMGIQHKAYALTGVQFHPESVMTGYGREMIRNFLKGVGK